MKNSYEFFSQTVYGLSETPVSDKSILFIESYNGAIHGDCKAILRKMLKDERFCDWTFLWTIPDSILYEPVSVEDERLQFVARDSYGFITACETAGIIVTGVSLPDYYIKKEGQTVLGCFPDSFFGKKELVTRERVALQMTMDKLDILYADNPAILERLKEWYPDRLPCSIIQGNSPRFTLPPVAEEQVVFSLKPSVMGQRFSVYEAKYKECMFFCAPYEKQVYFRVEKKLYRQFLYENEPDILAHTGSEEIPFCETARNAEIVVTDNVLNALDAARMQIPCIYITASTMLPEYFPKEETKWLSYAANWKEAVELLREKIGKLGEKRPLPEAETGLNEILDIVSGDKQPAPVPDGKERKAELWIIPGDMPGGFWEALRYYKQDKDVSVLVRSTRKGMLWKQKYPLANEKKLYCKIGACARDAHGKRTEKILREDWRRMIGDQYFEQIYAWEKKDGLWEELYATCPAKNLKEVGKTEIAQILFESLVSDSRFDSRDKLEIADMDGQRCCVLGRDGDRTYYLREKAEWKDVTVVFVQKGAQKTEYEELMQKNEMNDSAYVFLDPYKYMESSEIRSRANVYWIPDNIFPIELLAKAREVRGYDEQVLFSEDLRILTR